MNTRDTDEQDRIVRQGRAAWARLKKDKSLPRGPRSSG
jgi:hypothetical protein